MKLLTLLRNVALLAVVAGLFYAAPGPASADDGCFQGTGLIFPEECVGCVNGDCWSLTCPDFADGDCDL